MDVNSVLENISKRREEVTALTDLDKQLTIDLGTLTAWDPSVVAPPKAGTKRDNYFRDLAREDVQIFLNKMNETSELVNGERLLDMPEATIILPRAKSVPKPKPPTKWERFAKRKNIKSNKGRDKLVWDEATKKWVPRYGFKKVQNDREKNWVEELPGY